MRFRRTKRLRIASAAVLLLVLMGAPLLLGLGWPSASTEAPDLARAYAAGMNSLGMAALVALPLAIVFGLWVLAGQRRLVNLKYLGQNARNRHNTIESLRTLATILGGAGLIVGSLTGLYGAMIAARPDIAYGLPLPFLTVELALILLVVSGALYAAGRIGR